MIDKRPIEEILDICLEKIKQGSSLDEALMQYPEYREELKELLSLAKGIENSSLPLIRDEAISSCLIKIGKMLSSEKVRYSKPKTPKIRLFSLFRFPSPVLAKGLVFAFILIFISWSAVTISADSLPGEVLYPIKLVTERARFLLTINRDEKAELRIIYSTKRVRELARHFDKKGKLSRQLIKATMDEAYLSLKDISRISRNRRGPFLSRLEYLNAHQKDILESLKQRVGLHQRELLSSAIRACNSRIRRLGRIKRKEVSLHEWGPGCRWR